MPTADTLIAADKLSKVFGLRPVLRGLTFEIGRGETVSLLGPNGSGKTTLMRLLAGLSRQTGGTLTIGGWSMPKEAAAVRAQLGMVGHQSFLYDDLTAEENLRFYARLYALDDVPHRVTEALQRIGLAKRARDQFGTFSRGMQQRLAIARATLHDPAVLLLDEPYTGLDVNGAAILDDLLRDWKRAGRTIVMTSHDLEHAATFSDRVLILGGGRIAVDSPIAAVGDLAALYADVTA